VAAVKNNLSRLLATVPFQKTSCMLAKFGCSNDFDKLIFERSRGLRIVCEVVNNTNRKHFVPEDRLERRVAVSKARV